MQLLSSTAYVSLTDIAIYKNKSICKFQAEILGLPEKLTNKEKKKYTTEVIYKGEEKRKRQPNEETTEVYST